MQDERDIFQEGDSTPLSNFADMHSPATYTSGSAVSNYVAPEVGPTQRDNSEEACMEFGHALPPIKSSYNNPTLSPKLLGQNNGSSNFKNNQRLQTPKVCQQYNTFCCGTSVIPLVILPVTQKVRHLETILIFYT